MNDEFTPPIATQPEDLYADLREQTAVMRLSEGLLAFADTDILAPVDGVPEANDVTDTPVAVP